MKGFQQMLVGLLLAGASLGIVMGAFTISFAETSAFSSTPTLSPSDEPIVPLNTPASQKIFTPTLEPLPTVSITPACEPPQNWIPYEVQTGDSIEELAARYGISTQQIREANCLISDRILPNTELYLPSSLPTSTVTASPTSVVIPTQTVGCGAPAGWITYNVKLNDNLFRISYNYEISVQELQFANCMQNSQIIRPGQVLYVPNVATRVPQPTATPTDDIDDEEKKPTNVPTTVPYP
jgi:LysM repeat protein